VKWKLQGKRCCGNRSGRLKVLGEMANPDGIAYGTIGALEDCIARARKYALDSESH
jgi:hypothetical protein